jgi:hypothetical protein
MTQDHSQYPKYCIEYYLEQGKGSEIIIGKEIEIGLWTLVNDLEPGDVIEVELTEEDKMILKIQQLRATIGYAKDSYETNQCKFPWNCSSWFNQNYQWQYVARMARSVIVTKSRDV